MQNINSQIREIDGEIAEIENLFSKIKGAGYQFTPMGQAAPLLTDVLNVRIGRSNLKATKANVQITKANLEASQKLNQSIEQFNRSSTKLSTRMLRLTWIIAILTFIIAILTFEQITDKCLYRKISSYKSTSIKVPLEEEATTMPPIEESQQSKP
jgi:hypothetical protein